MNGIGAAVRWLTHPVTVASAVVLLVNDHVLKDSWPGTVTGKLSDLSGLIAAPALLGLLLAVVSRRVSARMLRTVAVGVVGAGFVWVKTFDAGALFASQLWSVVDGPSVILRDPTDLVTLPGLAVAWFVCERARRREPIDDRAARRVRLAVVLPVVVVAVAATPAPALPDAVVLVEAVDGQIRVSGTFGVATSSSGTGDWRWDPASDQPDGSVRAQQALRLQELESAQQSQDCVPGDPDRCYRVRGGGETGEFAESPDGAYLGVEQTADGGRSWRTAWEIPPDRWPYLTYAHEYESRPDPMGFLASVDVEVRAVPGGHQVFVANGMEGLTVRAVDGDWSRVGLRLPATEHAKAVDVQPQPLASAGTATYAEVAATAIAIELALLGLLLLTGIGHRRRLWWLPITLTALLLPVSVLLLPTAEFFSAGWGGMSLALAVMAAIGLPLIMNDRGRGLALLLAGGSIAVGVAFYLPYFGWSLGIPQAYPRYAGLVSGLIGFGLVAVPLLRSARDRSPKSAASRDRPG